MRDKIMNVVELDNLSRNISMLNTVLGYEVPREILNDSELTDKIMNITELDTMARNIDMVNTVRGGIYSANSTRTSPIPHWWVKFELAIYSIVPIAFILYVISYFIKFYL